MSKSLGNVITPLQLIEKFGVDGARYCLLAEISGDKDSDISWQKFQARYDADLKHTVGNIFSRLVVLAQKNGITELGITNNEPGIKDHKKAFTDHIEQIQIAHAIKDVQTIFEEINKYLDQTKPWQETDFKKLKQILEQALNNFIQGIELLEPIIPQTAAKVLATKKDDRLVVPKENIHLFS